MQYICFTEPGFAGSLFHDPQTAPGTKVELSSENIGDRRVNYTLPAEATALAAKILGLPEVFRVIMCYPSTIKVTCITLLSPETYDQLHRLIIGFRPDLVPSPKLLPLGPPEYEMPNHPAVPPLTQSTGAPAGLHFLDGLPEDGLIRRRT